MIKCILVNKTSKQGNEYLALEIYVGDTFLKTVYLEKAEQALINYVLKDKEK